MTATDAQFVEAAFRNKLAALGDEPKPRHSEAARDQAQADVTAKPVSTRRARIAARTIRQRDKEHRKFVSTQPCLVCGRTPADPHHLRFAQPRALSRKVSDEFTVPLCRVHHRELHRHGAELAWWQSIRIDPLPVARRLWQHARHDGTKVPSVTDGETGPNGESHPDGRAIP